MKFAIFFEVSVPRPWGDTTEWQVYQNCLEQIRLADELGFDQVWAVEHHFLEEYSHCSAPEVFLTAAAMQTKNIRIGHGIMTILPPFNHPVRCAERAATLDLLSNGRLEFGTGRSTTWTELGGFRADPDETKNMWDDALRAIPRIWQDEVFSWESKYWSFPPRTVVPKPYQKPHPPLWVAVSSPETSIQAAERGIGMLGVSIGSPKDQEVRINDYRRIIKDCEPVGAFVNEQINTLNWLYVDEDLEQGREMGKKLIGTFNYLAQQTVGIKQAYPSKAYANAGLLYSLRAQGVNTAGEAQIRDGFAIGNPDNVTEQLKTWESMGVDCVAFLLNAAEVIPQEKVLASLRLFGEQVMPKFKRKETTGTFKAPALATGD